MALYKKLVENLGLKSMLPMLHQLVEGKVTSENLNGTVNYNFSQVSVTGSPLTDKYVKLLSTRDALDSIYVTNNEKFKDIRSGNISPSIVQTSIRYRSDSWSP